MSKQLDWGDMHNAGVLTNLRQRWHLHCTKHMFVHERLDWAHVCHTSVLSCMCQRRHVQCPQHMHLCGWVEWGDLQLACMRERLRRQWLLLITRDLHVQ